ncbi:MAG: helix-turn-helix transcriptional regulator [Bacteroidota bacterium]
MMIERLKIILSHFKLTPSALADIVGVPRSSISHLLSGRNKPSLDFVLKLVDKFPEVDLYWFLHGKGSFTPLLDISSEVNAEIGSASRPNASSEAPNLPLEDKKISKIAVFYEDGTFETYRPKK